MSKAGKSKNTSLADFESALNELEQLVERMERGEQTLEESLKDFERGIALTKACQKSLKDAEQRVQKLVKQNGTFATEPFSTDE